MPPVREALRRFPRQLRRGLVDLPRPLAQAELGQRDRRAAEGVGFHHVRAGLEVAVVDVAHQVRAGQVQHLRAVLLVPIVALDVERQRLHAAAHAAVAQQHPVTQRIKQMGSGHQASSETV